MRQDYLLAAHIEGSSWFCHKGTQCDNGELEADDPFMTEDLVVKNIAEDAFEPERAPRRRIGAHISGSRLLTTARTSHSWARAVAVATWRAESIRAARRPFDATAASAGFEANPFRWTVTESRLSHADIIFAWAWVINGAWKRELVSVKANHLSADARGVPSPEAFQTADQSLWCKMLAGGR